MTGSRRPSPTPWPRVPHRPPRRRQRAAAVGRMVALTLSALLFAGSGLAWYAYHDLFAGIARSQALGGAAGSADGDTNILIMGLDSRLDENGNPLPTALYDALHAGDQKSGGYNANVLMLVHVPGDGSRATSVSLPRDDYVGFPGAPDGVAHGKIKQAYGYALDAERKSLVAQHVTDRAVLERQGREAGRREEIATVRQLLGGVAVDHFAEVTLAAFYEIAQVVQPITVCVKEETSDTYSGADFHPGQQQLSAAQAVAFVRQRRDYHHPGLNFTDLDRERRQQAFIASLVHQLGSTATVTDLGRLRAVLSVVRRTVAVDDGMDLLAFAQQATNLTSGDITFVTLPIERFGVAPDGEDVNIVDVARIQGMIQRLFAPPAAPTPASPGPPRASPVTADVVNANGRTGLAAATGRVLAAHGLTPGATSTTARHARSVVRYAPDSADAAARAAAALGGLPTVQDRTVAAHHLAVQLGTGFRLPGTPPPPPPAPTPSAPDGMDARTDGGIPCVK